jgi:ribosomal-protein-alanine N-acetyltransferase
VIETERLLLRRFRPDDLDAVARWQADPVFMRHMGPLLSRAESKAALERYEAHWREYGFGLLAACDKATGNVIGRTGVQYHRAWPHDPEVGWSLDPGWWGKGRATEMGTACLRWGFDDLGFRRLVSITTEANLASRRVMEKLGFELHEVIPFPELGIDLWVHALDRDALYP